MATTASQNREIQWGADDAALYFHSMVAFVGFGQEEVEAIKATSLIIEKYIPDVVGKFYARLLAYPPTRKIFLKKDGSLDQEYLQLRMHHLTNFWRRTASGVYDDEYARFVDYVGRAHTNRGADPKIYIPERYVIAQVGLVQQTISEALYKELHEIDPDLEVRASRAWNLLMMIILEMLARAYSDERVVEGEGTHLPIDAESIRQLAVQMYERNVGMYRSIEHINVKVASAAEIPDGERKLVEVEGVAIGVFHHKGGWYALRNSCLHRGGPVCTGPLKGDVLTCPWHGYQYDVTDGRLLLDASAHLDAYPVELRDGDVYLRFPIKVMDAEMVQLDLGGPGMAEKAEMTVAEQRALEKNEFLISELKPGQIHLVQVDGEDVAVYLVGGQFYATQDECTHTSGPLHEGELDGHHVICPFHDSCFDIRDGSVLRGPAKEPLRTYKVILDGEIGRVE